MNLRKNRSAPLRLAVFSFLVGLFFFGTQALAHTPVFEETLDDAFKTWSVRVISIAAVIVLALLAYVIIRKNETERQKQVVFWTIVTVVIAATLFVATSTVYINFQAATGGPVHWHADFKVIGCGQELDLVDPKGLSNKVGTPTLHEHDDNRIHVEGVLYHLADGSLGRFFHEVGGLLTDHELIWPLVDGTVASYQNGDACPDGSIGEVQVFVYSVDGRVVRQRKIEKPDEYVLSGHQQVPPGDCLVVEFGPAKAETEATCQFYDIALQKGDLIPEIAE